MAELTTAEQTAYQVSFDKAKKQQARDQGAADAGGGALQRARERALGESKPVESGLRNPSSVFIAQLTRPKLFGMTAFCISKEAVASWPPTRNSRDHRWHGSWPGR